MTSAAALSADHQIREYEDYIDQMRATLKKRVKHRGPLRLPPRTPELPLSEEVRLVPVTPGNFDMVEVHRIVAFEGDQTEIWAIIPQHILDHPNYPGPPPYPALWVTFGGVEERVFCSAERTVPQRLEVQLIQRGIGTIAAVQAPRELREQAEGLFRRDVCEAAIEALKMHGVDVGDLEDEPRRGELKLWVSLVVKQRGWVRNRHQRDTGNEATRRNDLSIDALRRAGLTLSAAVARHYEDSIAKKLAGDAGERGIQTSELIKDYSKEYRKRRSARAGRDRSPHPNKTSDGEIGYDLIDPILQGGLLEACLKNLPSFWRQLYAESAIAKYVERQRKRLTQRQKALKHALRAMDISSLERAHGLKVWSTVLAAGARWRAFEKMDGLKTFVRINPDLADHLVRSKTPRLSPLVTRPLLVFRNALTGPISCELVGKPKLKNFEIPTTENVSAG